MREIPHFFWYTENWGVAVGKSPALFRLIRAQIHIFSLPGGTFPLIKVDVKKDGANFPSESNVSVAHLRSFNTLKKKEPLPSSERDH